MAAWICNTLRVLTKPVAPKTPTPVPIRPYEAQPVGALMVAQVLVTSDRICDSVHVAGIAKLHVTRVIPRFPTVIPAQSWTTAVHCRAAAVVVTAAEEDVVVDRLVVVAVAAEDKVVNIVFDELVAALDTEIVVVNVANEVGDTVEVNA